MPSYALRPFPPPALAHVPIEYIIQQLHTLAPHYWSKPETTDCSIIVPLDGLLRKTGQAPQPAGSLSDPSSNPMPPFDSRSPSTSPAAGPSLRPAPRMVMKLHMDYLSAHSTLLRGLLSGASPLDLIPSAGSSPSSTPRDFTFQLPIPPSDPQFTARGLPKVPRLLPFSESLPHPTIYLPVPDPSSLRLLIHYMYFNSITYIESALDEGTVTWEGLARNVEFLGMGMEIKVYLGRWYRRWRRGDGDSSSRVDVDYDNYSDSDSDDDSYFESDDEDVVMASASSVTSASVGPVEDDDKMDVEEPSRRPERDYPPRGRKTNTRQLGHAISDPGPIRGRGFTNAHRTSHSSSPVGRGE
ncbi:hypothetical protein BC835DRAFT_1262622 [Cytidiella melzeri]|nr:hypothetical protein BC835DRAFT_1262622 [Cytidiella melzeri]